MQTDELARWLALDALPRVGLAKKLALLDKLGWSELWRLAELGQLPLSAAQHRALLQPELPSIESTLSWLHAQPERYLLPINHLSYPAMLRHIDDPPLLLFAEGDISLLSRPMLAMVGSRSASISGRQLAHDWAKQLTQAGWLIVSGLAEGIDGASHQGALAAGATISVEGCGLARVYPHRHQSLARQIQQQGLRLSEFWPHVGVRRSHFPRRNRIVSGLSRGTIVVEADLKSGSLITARLASEQGRDVFAVPGSVLDHNHLGCHQLIQNGAKLVTQPVDIIEELLPQLSGDELKPLSGCADTEAQNLPVSGLLDSVDYNATSVDEIVSRSQLAVGAVLEQLTQMELDGWIAAVPGGYIRLRGRG